MQNTYRFNYTFNHASAKSLPIFGRALSMENCIHVNLYSAILKVGVMMSLPV